MEQRRGARTAALPTGTVTFVFTDIEGSTRLLQALGAGYAGVLATHYELLRTAFDARGGTEVNTEGDALFYAFARAEDAVLAAVDGQRALAAHVWPPGADLKVRIGMHTGSADVIGDNYVGLAVHEAARVSAAAHGGQIVVSHATRSLLGDETEMLDLGEHRLKDITKPQRLYQVGADGLERTFPALRTASPRLGNLPQPITRFIGRDDDCKAIADLVSSARLVTLTGIGGVGKTRLGIEAARSLAPAFPGGTWFVDLSSVIEPGIVAAAAARALGLRDDPKREPIATLRDFLFERTALVVIDNCEHLLDASARLIQEMLDASASTHVLATSREPIGLAGESVWRVPSMTDAAPTLFVERARAAVHTFTADQTTEPLIAQICERVDGIPLAIELAAAKVAVLSVPDIAARLDDRFRLLTGGARTALERHQTMRGAVEWSYDLLSAQERIAFSRLSVFVGGFTLEAAEHVIAGEPIAEQDVLDLVATLVRKSLLTVEGTSPIRYRMLETLRQFARERLSADENARVRNEHLGWFVRFVDGLLNWDHGYVPKANDLVEADHDNIRAALDWADVSRRTDELLAITSWMWLMWHRRGYWAEGLQRLDEAFARVSEQTEPRVRALLHYGIAQISYLQDDHERTRAHCAQALPLFEEAGDAFGQIWTTIMEAYTRSIDGETAHRITEQVLTIAKRIGSVESEAGAHHFLATKLLSIGDIQGAVREDLRSLEVAGTIGKPITLGYSFHGLAIAESNRGNLEQARRFTEQALAVFREARDLWMTVRTMIQLSRIARRTGEVGGLHSLLDEALALAEGAGYQTGRVLALGEMAVDAIRKSPEEARRLADEAVSISRRSASLDVLAEALSIRSHVLAELAEFVPAARDLGEAIEADMQEDDAFAMVRHLYPLAGVKSMMGAHEEAATIIGIGDALSKERSVLAPPHTPALSEAFERARAAIGEATFEAARARGRAMPVDEGLAWAIQTAGQSAT